MSTTVAPTAPLKIVFMGTALLASATLKALARERTLAIAAVVSQPDKPRGRDLRLQPTPVKALALSEGLPVLQPGRARDASFIEQLRALQLDLIVVAAYGQLLPQALLDLPRFGCLNVHASLLPKYRGAAPIAWAILNGDAETGVTIMKMDAGLDTGPMVSRVTTPIRPEDNGQTLHDRLAQLGAELLIRTIPDYVSGKLVPQPQPAQGASSAPKIKKEDGRMDWAQPARALWQRVRGLAPWPGAFTFLNGEGHAGLLKIWAAEVDTQRSGAPGSVLAAGHQEFVVACGEQALRLVEVQREGGRRLRAADFLAGHPLAPGSRLGP